MTSKAFGNIAKLNAFAVNVTEFGAVGDGVANDAAAIQAAIDSGAKVITGTPGATYLIGSAGIAITSKTGMTLDFRGSKLKLGAVSSQSMTSLGVTSILFTSCTDCGIINAEIDGNSKASNVVGFLSNTRCFARNNVIYSGGASGQIAAINNTKNEYTDNRIFNGQGSARGIWLGNFGANLLENDALVTGNMVYGHGATGIVGSIATGIIANNRVYSNAGAGIIYGGASGYRSSNLTITANVCTDNLFHGIQSDSVFGTDADLPYNITITANVCFLNSPAGAGSGIYLAAHTLKTIVSDNICVDNGEYGIVLGGRNVDISVHNNVCSDTRSGGSRTQSIGISVVAQGQNIERVSIKGNICTNASDKGILVTNVSTSTITSVQIEGNICDSNATGIFVAEAVAGEVTAALVSNNICRNNSTVDLRLSLIDVVIGANKYSTQTDLLFHTFANADTSPSVKGRTFYQASNAGATTITTFDDGAIGQEITVFASNGNTTLGHGSGIDTPTGAGVVIASGGSVTLRRNTSAWVFVSQSF